MDMNYLLTIRDSDSGPHPTTLFSLNFDFLINGTICFFFSIKCLFDAVINDGSTGGGGDGTDEDCGSTSYRTRSLPSWGKNKQRPLSNADDLEELYAKVRIVFNAYNFCCFEKQIERHPHVPK